MESAVAVCTHPSPMTGIICGMTARELLGRRREARKLTGREGEDSFGHVADYVVVY